MSFRVLVFLSVFFILNVCNNALAASGDYVIILHGIARSSSHMEPVELYLQSNGYEVFNLDYKSTDYKLEKLVDDTFKDIEGRLTDKSKKVNFVGYSMGCLLTRGILTRYKFNNLGRVVFLAPPSKGSEIADFLKDNWLYKYFYGPAGQQLTTDQSAIKPLLGNIYYELGIIAGDRTIDPISSFIIPGDDDGKVSVERTKIEGAKDHIVVHSSHTFFPSNDDALMQTLYFLQNGRFKRD